LSAPLREAVSLPGLSRHPQGPPRHGHPSARTRAGRSPTVTVLCTSTASGAATPSGVPPHSGSATSERPATGGCGNRVIGCLTAASRTARSGKRRSPHTLNWARDRGDHLPCHRWPGGMRDRAAATRSPGCQKRHLRPGRVTCWRTMRHDPAATVLPWRSKGLTAVLAIRPLTCTS